MVGLDPSVASTRMNQYERGRHEPNYRFVSKLAKAFKVPEAYFYASGEALAAWILAYEVLPRHIRVKIERQYGQLPD